MTIVVTLVPLTWGVVRGVVHGDFGVDIIALLAMLAALIGGELLAGALLAVMVTGGEALEDYAAGRAQRDLTALLRRAPQVARRRARGGGRRGLRLDSAGPPQDRLAMMIVRLAYTAVVMAIVVWLLRTGNPVGGLVIVPALAVWLRRDAESGRLAARVRRATHR